MGSRLFIFPILLLLSATSAAAAGDLVPLPMCAKWGLTNHVMSLPDQLAKLLQFREMVREETENYQKIAESGQGLTELVETIQAADGRPSHTTGVEAVRSYLRGTQQVMLYVRRRIIELQLEFHFKPGEFREIQEKGRADLEEIGISFEPEQLLYKYRRALALVALETNMEDAPALISNLVKAEVIYSQRNILPRKIKDASGDLRRIEIYEKDGDVTMLPLSLTMPIKKSGVDLNSPEGRALLSQKIDPFRLEKKKLVQELEEKNRLIDQSFHQITQSLPERFRGITEVGADSFYKHADLIASGRPKCCSGMNASCEGLCTVIDLLSFTGPRPQSVGAPNAPLYYRASSYLQGLIPPEAFQRLDVAELKQAVEQIGPNDLYNQY